MAGIHSDKSSIRKTPPAAIAKKVAPPQVRKTTTRKPAKPTIDSMEWRQMVAAAAYFRAEARGFAGGSPEQDWLDAESELMARLTPARSK